jgi:hypothetical protein
MLRGPKRSKIEVVAPKEGRRLYKSAKRKLGQFRKSFPLYSYKKYAGSFDELNESLLKLKTLVLVFQQRTHNILKDSYLNILKDSYLLLLVHRYHKERASSPEI